MLFQCLGINKLLKYRQIYLVIETQELQFYFCFAHVIYNVKKITCAMIYFISFCNVCSSGISLGRVLDLWRTTLSSSMTFDGSL